VIVLPPHPEIDSYYYFVIISSRYMRAIIFDMDGVLVESMSYHYQAMKTAIKEVVNIDLDKRIFYLLEGMPVAEMALEILKIKILKFQKT
jgi:beta-phosphoglucomutase-like phosphatase (HAD superfamily)